jgi:isopentenyl-diphosphate delta-isomerase
MTPAEQEQVVLVDDEDRPVGAAAKLVAHRTGARHRAVSVFLFDGRGRLLLQRRAAGKYHSAGRWANTCCGHPRPGEPVLNAASRRLRDEMGIECRLERVGAFTYRADVGDGLVEHEIDHLFVGRHDGDPRPDHGEVDAWRWQSPDDLERDLLANPDVYAAWLRPALDALKAVQPALFAQDRLPL